MRCTVSYFLLVWLLILPVERVTASKYYSSTSHLELLLKAQGTLIQFLDEYKEWFTKDRRKLKVIDKFLDRCKKEQKIALKNIEYYLGNPLNAYTLIKRMFIDVNYIESAVERQVVEKQYASRYPVVSDLVGAVDGILRLQSVYRLNTADLAKGILVGDYSPGNIPYFEKMSPMLARDCFEIGRIAYSNENYYRALEWLLEAFYRCDDNDYHINYFTMLETLEIILQTYYDMEKGGTDDFQIFQSKLNLLLKHFHNNKLSPDFDYTGLIPERKFIDRIYIELQEEERKMKSKNATQTDLYISLCRGEIALPSNKVKRLKCYYVDGPNPFLLLARIKAEQLHRAPTITMFYDVISDEEIKTLQFEAMPLLRRSWVSDQNETSFTSPPRVSKTTWFNDTIPIAAKLSRRVSDVTNLSTSTAEWLQVVNYGIGGHYEAHYDFFEQDGDSRENGNRIATVLFYMTNVAQGGATVFLDLGLTVFPVKNAALFWKNLRRSGKPDYRTKHAACPVLRGSKWVANKWLHETSPTCRTKISDTPTIKMNSTNSDIIMK